MSMRQRASLAFVLLAFGALATWKATARARPAEVSFALLQNRYIAGIDTVDAALRDLSASLMQSDVNQLQSAFRRARAAYKRIEFLVEFDDAFKAIALHYVEGPFMTIALNGPPIPTVNEDDSQIVLEPRGFQVIEAALFPRPTGTFREVVSDQVQQLRRTLGVMRSQPPETLEANRRALDAARLEIARVATLGVAGFDATLSGDGLRESADALHGVADGLQSYAPVMRKRDSAGWDSLNQSLAAAVEYLEAAPSFEQFDRLTFLTGYVNPLTLQLSRLQRSLELPLSQHTGAWFPTTTNLYAPRALNARWFAPDYAPPAASQLVGLGRQLFFDPALSRSGSRSCATCHLPSRAFTDGRARALVEPGHGDVRNTPSLINAGLQAFQFADQRARYLEFQVEDVMQNPREMAQPVDSAAVRLSADTAFVARLMAAVGKSQAPAVTGQMVAVAIAAYVRSLEALNSRFDRAVRGDTEALTAAERRGFNLFMGKARCATCHFPPLFGGTMPPSYREAEPEVIGVPERPLSVKPVIDPDLGVFAINRAPLHRHAFKTPSVRNVELTAPYMHNGVFRTLDEVVEFYDVGGGNGLGMRLPNQTLPPDSLQLTKGEKRDLVAFMKALTDTALTAAN
jgi:cytochrome c peroxidase